MTPIDPSMEPMLDMFVFETTTLLEQLDEIMIEAEKSGLNLDAINEIFRIMHTIKGSSAMMGQESMADLSHHIEDLFFLIREEPARLGKNNSNVIYDLLFKSSDFLKAAIESVSNHSQEPQGAQELIETITHEANIMKGLVPDSSAQSGDNPVSLSQDNKTESGSNTSLAAQETEPQNVQPEIHEIRVHFQDDAQMENIRAFMLLTQLKECCDWLESEPANPETDSQLSAEIVKNGFLLRFALNTSLDHVINIIENSVNISSYEILTSPTMQNNQKDKAKGSPSSDAQGNVAREQNHDPNKDQGVSTTLKTGKQSLISVNQNKLDQLMDIVSEIVIAESMVSSNPDLKGLVLDNFQKSTRQLRKLTDELQDVVMSMRMVPLSGLFQKMNRIVRDMSKKLNKNVLLITNGDDTEVDKTISDTMADPFMHMIRNAMDHAIETPEERKALGKPETGHITISAENVGGEIVIIISDDGRGLNTEQILNKAKSKGLLTKPENEYTEKEIFSMILLPGFSTNEQVTEFSGRGVGMDVVVKNIEKVGGTVSIESKMNRGTSFIIKIPLTLAIVDGMEIAVSDMVLTLPITSIRESFEIQDKEQIIYDTDGKEMIMVRGQCFPIIRLHQIFEIPGAVTDLEKGIMIIIENDNQHACLFADDLIGEQQVVVKPFPHFLNRYNIKNTGLAGCTILGDGSISLILDANNLLTNF
jgi:two-component system chemotaxis sensor kinase CheA